MGGLFIAQNWQVEGQIENIGQTIQIQNENASYVQIAEIIKAEKYDLKINDFLLRVEIADIEEKRMMGLSGRQNLAENEGMLFVFEEPDFYSFWMKDMNFPIDIVWIGQDLKIADITENVSPETFPNVFGPKAKIKYVLEVNAGLVNGKINIGDIVALPEILATEITIKSVLYDVPFVSQAPLGDWSDPRQQGGCEEASSLMAMAWARGARIVPQLAEKELLAISDYEFKKYGNYYDTSAKDTVSWIFNDYYKYGGVEVFYDIKANDIIKALMAGNLVIAPVNGRKLKNAFYRPPGPIQHMILIIGYDAEKKEFITNDPGTKYGKNFRYKENVLESALEDYRTGEHLPILEIKTAMIVVRKS